MAANLVSQILQAIAPEFITRIASSLGLKAGDVQQALAGSIPAILGALVGVATKPEGPRKIVDAIGQLADINPLEASGTMNQQTLAAESTSALSSVLGGNSLDMLTNAVGKFSGMSGSKAGSIIGLVAPIVMNGIRQQAGGLDASKITDLLSSQKDLIAAAVPAGLAGMLSNSDVLSDVQSTGSSAAARPNRAAKTSRFGLRGAADPSAPARSEMNRLAWVIPLALVLGGLWYFLGDRKDNQPTIPTAQTTTTTTDAATSTGAIPDPSAEVTTAIASLRTTLQGITDGASAKAALPRLQEADGLLNAVNDRVAGLSPDQRKAVAAPVATTMATLTELIDKVLAIPGVAEIVKPVIDPIKTKLEAITKV